VLKGLDGVLEVAGGILLLLLSPQAIQHLARVLTAHELSEDPHELIARYLLHTTGQDPGLMHASVPPVMSRAGRGQQIPGRASECTPRRRSAFRAGRK
jgi:hypothetical protein